MKTHYYLYFIGALMLSLLFTQCKSAKRSLKQGDYDQSVLLSVEKLRGNSQHQSSIDILKDAYPSALQQHLNTIEKSKTSGDLYQWEKQVEAYSDLNKLYDAISACAPCASKVQAKSFYQEEKDAREKASSIRYQEAEKLVRSGTRENARQAYQYLEIVQNLIPNYANSKQLQEEAFELATFKVVVEQVLVTSKTYQLSNEYFQKQIEQFLQTNKQLNKFVQFYTPKEATEGKVTPDHVITLQFDDFVVGQTILDRHTKSVSKDSVKVGETKVRDRTVPVYNTVKADLTTHKKSVISSGLLDVNIREFATSKVVQNKKFEGTFNWFSEWATYKGDERALRSEELKLTKLREQNPPPPQQLFIEFSKPLYNQVTSYLKNYYAKY